MTDDIALTLTCQCGKTESFPGDLLTAVNQAAESNRWFITKRGRTVCIDCFIWGQDDRSTRDRRAQASSR